VSERTEQLLEELLAWTRFAQRESFVSTMADVMRDAKHLQAYEATDGTRTQVEVAKVAGLSQAAVSNLWSRWRRMGLLVSGDARPRHLARPTDLGIIIGAATDARG
jgi:hypothetical protein